MLDTIVLYTKQDDNYTKQETGWSHYTGAKENILNYYFNISLQTQETKEYYLKLASTSCAVYFKLHLQNKETLYKKEIKHQLILALFFGSIVVLILYNFFLFLFTKDITYLYYILYLSFSAWNHVSYTGMGMYIVPVEFFALDAYFAIYYISFISIFTTLFTQKILNLKKYKKLNFILNLFLATSILFILFTSPDFYPINAVVYAMFILLFYIILLSFYLLYKGDKNAKYLVLGWSLIFFGWIMLGNLQLGYWSILTQYPYFYEFTVLSEAILFSIALANKLNTTKDLEKAVQTNKILTKELHNRVKNNMQFIISMYQLKLAKFTDKDISTSLKEVEGSIQAMSATHEMLYTQDMVSHFNTQEYFNTLIQRLETSFKANKIEIKLDVQTNLDVDDSIYIGIILNELITNSLKYAFEKNEGRINISLSKEDKLYKLIFSDNGKGFDTTLQRDTFGLELINILVENELNGKLSLDTTQGTVYNIQWN